MSKVTNNTDVSILTLIDRVFTHEWFHDIYRTHGCAERYRWTICYECANDGPIGSFDGPTYVSVLEQYYEALCKWPDPLEGV